MLLIISFLTFGCNSIYQNQNSESVNEIIIQKILQKENVTKNINLIKTPNNGALTSDLKEKIFFDESDYSEFGDLRGWFSDGVIKVVFNKDEVTFFLEQLEISNNWNAISNVNIKNFNSDNIEDIFWVFSNPVFTKNKEYSLIHVYNGNRNLGIGNYKNYLLRKTDNEYNIIGSFFHKIE